MLTATFSYDFTLADGKRFKGAAFSTEEREEKTPPRFPNTSIQCDLEHVDTIMLSHGGTPKVFWDREVVREDNGFQKLLREPRDLALIVTCEGQVLIVRSEPTVNGRVGLAAYTEKGKVVFVGIGDIVESGGPTPDYALVANFKEAHDSISFSPKSCAHCHGSVKKGKTTPAAPQ